VGGPSGGAGEPGGEAGADGARCTVAAMDEDGPSDGRVTWRRKGTGVATWRGACRVARVVSELGWLPGGAQGEPAGPTRPRLWGIGAGAD
jgi:hypothetical protein